ncbi:MAG TPA: GNAT family N-acetyltransferase [Acidobacteriaceae bacterium]|nr:GNAT family N-acetyltransferase [Acidobacteriaceae bacterium]
MSEESLQHEGSRHADEVRITHVTKLADFDRCVEIQLAVWGYAEGDLIPKRVFIVARSIGGQVIGAYADDVLVGFAMALPGYRDGHSYLHSHMLAVLPAYRNRGIGRRMKLAQRDDALARGFDLMEWTFDPLEIKNAHLNIARLGAIARRYIPDFYGASTSPLQGGLASDRLVAEWWLRSERVRRRVGELPSETLPEAAEPAQTLVQVHVNKEVELWKRDANQRTLAVSLQSRNRLTLTSSFSEGLAVTGYQCSPEGDGCFLLERHVE